MSNFGSRYILGKITLVNNPTVMFNDAEGDPVSIGTASDGTSAYSARRDHAHAGSHTALSNIGTNTHAQIDTHIAATGTSVHELGSISTQASNNVSITGGSITGITDLAVADGGTGTSTGSITGTTALTFTAGGTNQNASLISSGTGISILKPGTNSTTAIQLQNAAGTSILNVDTTNGRVGIGTTGPGSLLHVNGSMQVSTANGIDYNPGSDTDVDIFTVGVTGTPKLFWDESFSSFVADARIISHLTGSASIPNFGVSNLEGMGMYRIGTSILGFSTNNTEQMRVDAEGDVGIGGAPGTAKLYVNGNVGIGTTGPAAALHVNGDIALVSDNQLYLESSAGAVGDSYLQYFSSDGTGRIGIFEDNSEVVTLKGGNLGIGTTGPNYKLDVGGGSSGYDIRGYDVYTHDGGVHSFSDINLKETKGDFSRGLNEILQLNPTYYQYKKGNELGLDQGSKAVGLIAQDVQNLIPEAVEVGQNGYLTLTQGPIFYAMVNAIQEQQEQIAKLRRDLKTALADSSSAPMQTLSAIPAETCLLETSSPCDPAAIAGGGCSPCSIIKSQQEQLDAISAEVQRINNKITGNVGIAGTEGSQELVNPKNDLEISENMAVWLYNYLVEKGISLAEDKLVLDKDINLGDSKIVIATDGSITAEKVVVKEVETEKLVIKTEKQKNGETEAQEELNNSTIGSAVISAGETAVEVVTAAVRENSKIFVTAKVPLAQSLAVTEKKVDESFTVELFKAIDKDIEFDWWIVESVEIGLSH